MRRRRGTAWRETLVLVLVVVALGFMATLPRRMAAAVDDAPSRPCAAVAAEHRAACLEAARALLAR